MKCCNYLYYPQMLHQALQLLSGIPRHCKCICGEGAPLLLAILCDDSLRNAGIALGIKA
jgi:hypothetical protein